MDDLHLEDAEIIRHSPCCKEGCGRKSVMRIRQYFVDDEPMYVAGCEDHMAELLETLKDFQNEH